MRKKILKQGFPFNYENQMVNEFQKDLLNLEIAIYQNKRNFQAVEQPLVSHFEHYGVSEEEIIEESCMEVEQMVQIKKKKRVSKK